MRTAIRTAGELLLTAGVVVLLFAAYLVAGTGWENDQDQSAASAELDRRWVGSGAVALCHLRTRKRPRPSRSGPQPCAVALLLEHVLYLLPGLLQAARRAVGAALGLEFRVVGGLADGLLGAALELLGLVAHLVLGRHP